MLGRLLIIALIAFAVTGNAAIAQSTRSVAITFDDLPYAGDSLAEAERATRALLAALDRYGVSADAFVIGNRVDVYAEVGPRKNLLRAWRDHGHALHNHSYTHPQYCMMSPAEYLADVERGQLVVSTLLAEASPTGRGAYYRAPYNDLGETAAERDTLVAWLRKRGIRLAPFTIEHTDYIFDDIYREALRSGNAPRADSIGHAYLAQLDSAFAFAEQLSVETFGREIPQVFLIHANRINAECLDQMLARLRERGYRFVTLDAAMSDTAYATENRYARRWGISWLHRWRIGLGLPNVLRKEPGLPTWISEAYRSSHSKE